MDEDQSLLEGWQLTGPDGDGFVWLENDNPAMPIETAKQDDTERLLFDGVWTNGYWLEGVGWWNGESPIEPTHWMPMPPPPGDNYSMINLGKLADVREKVMDWLELHDPE